jgi:DNA-binding transcriptional ArsR family regulator
MGLPALSAGNAARVSHPASPGQPPGPSPGQPPGPGTSPGQHQPAGASHLPRGPAELEALDAVFGALAHQSRRTILAVLHARGGEMTSGAIAARFDCSWPTTSQHLQVLARAGLVTIALRGREHVYRLDTQRLHQVAGAWLSRFG